MQLGGNENAVRLFCLKLITSYSDKISTCSNPINCFKYPFLFQATFFRQHHVDTKDILQKYKSRAAQLYRDKLHHLATQAMRLHGTKVLY